MNPARRALLAAAASGCFASCEFRDGAPQPAGALLGTDMALGHALRDGTLPAPTEERRIGAAIVGAGIGGLSAAWQLARQGETDVAVFELEDAAGGNARHGENAVSPYPLGAHYLPLPASEAVSVRELLADLGVLAGDPHAPLPRYDERHLVHAPQERLYKDGLWHDGLLPRAGAGARAIAQIERFDALVAALKARRDGDGRRLFASPSLLAGRHADSDALAATSMDQWMRDNGFDAPLLTWHVDYACRDDFGARPAQVSAWAGLHYFACRDGVAADADPHNVLTWPEGNGHLVRRLVGWLRDRGVPPIRTGAPCIRLATARGGAVLDIYHAAERRSVRYRAARVIWAAPAFALARVWENAPPAFAALARSIDVSPWLTANLTLASLPEDAGPAPLAWDNVLFDSPALGYVVATHQRMRVAPGPTVLTYYWPLADLDPAAGRARLAAAPWQAWAAPILDELARPHPGLRRQLQRLDLWRWPHAMPRPVPGFRAAPVRAALAALDGPLLFAHSDLSGMPLFEEAHWAGVRAARRLLGGAGVSAPTPAARTGGRRPR
ncbi:MAG: NAD(P)-binding protein [Burkholderiales bacterium]|nr:NAD(P)-binding protein [Burkholderiales bacterium]